MFLLSDSSKICEVFFSFFGSDITIVISPFKLLSKGSNKSISVLINSSYNFEISLHIITFLPEKFF